MRMLCACPVLGIPSSPMTSVPCELRKAWNDENQWPLWSLLAMLCDSDTWAILHTEAPFSLAERRLCRRIEESWAEPFSNVSFSFSSFQAYNFHLQTTQKACGFWCSAWSKLFLKSNFWFSLVNTQNGHKKEPFCTKGEQLHNCTIAVQCWSVICTNWRGEQAEHTADFQVAVVLWHQSQHRKSLIFVLFELNHIPHFSMCARHSAEHHVQLTQTIEMQWCGLHAHAFLWAMSQLSWFSVAKKTIEDMHLCQRLQTTPCEWHNLKNNVFFLFLVWWAILSSFSHDDFDCFGQLSMNMLQSSCSESRMLVPWHVIFRFLKDTPLRQILEHITPLLLKKHITTWKHIANVSMD